MTWFESVPALLVSGLVLLGPGFAAASALRVSGLMRLAAAGPLSATAAGLGAIAFDALDLGWGPGQLAVSALVLAALAWGLRAVVEETRREGYAEDSPEPLPRHNRGTVVLALACASTAVGAVVIATIPQPDLLAQAHDTIFHAPAVEQIITTGHGSSLTLGSLAPTPARIFYPGAWHDLAAVTVLALAPTPVAVSVPTAMNALNLVAAAVLWPLGVLWLSRVALGTSRLRTLGVGIAAASMPLFPYLPLQFGVIYPFFLGLTQLAAALGLAVTALGWPRRPTTASRALLALLLGVPGMALTHPSILNTLVLLLTPLVLIRLGTVLRRASVPSEHGRRATLAPWLAILAWLALLAALWRYSRPRRSSASNWENQGDPVAAIIDSLTQAHLSYPANPALVGILLVGIGAALCIRGTRWLVWAYLLTVAAYVIGSWGGGGDLRWLLTGVWYNDHFRIASLGPIVAVPLAGLGIAALAQGVRRLVAKAPHTAAVAAAVVVAVIAAALLPLNPGLARSISDGREKYALTSDSRLISTDERALMARLPGEVPRGTLVAGDPLTGAGLAMVYGGVQMVQPSNSPAPTPAGRFVMARLDRAARDPRVCQAARSLRLEYVLDFGHESVHGSQETYRQGFTYLDERHGFVPVDRVGSARLLRIAACDPGWTAPEPPGAQE